MRNRETTVTQVVEHETRFLVEVEGRVSFDLVTLKEQIPYDEVSSRGRSDLDERKERALQEYFDRDGIPKSGTKVTITPIHSGYTYEVDSMFKLKKVKS